MADRGISFSWVNHLVGAELAASSQINGLPVGNLLTDFLYDKWRSDGTTSVTFTATLPGARSIRMLGLFGSLYSAMTTWRLQLSNVALGAGEIFDSAVVNAGFVKVNQVASGDLCQAVMVLPATVSATYMQLDVVDPASPRSYSQAGKMWLGDLKFPKFGRSWGAKEGLVDPSEKVRSIGGQQYVNVRDASRQAQFNLDYLTDEEVNTWARDFILTVRKSKPFVMVPEANLTYQNNGAMLGTYVDLPATTRLQVDIRSQPHQIEETL